MRYSYTLAALLAATSVTALPLNINLGAYSPALVVGDGEISFGAGTDVTNLMTTLSGASASGTTAGTGTGTAAAGQASAAASAAPAAASAAPAASATVAAAAVDPTLQMGMGKAIAPREPEAAVDESAAAAKLKRDLTGFNAALNFAAGALTTSPEVQLGTGEGGSGVGITVNAGAAGGKAAAAAPAAKRDESSSLPTVTMLKIRTLGGSVQNSKRQTLDTRSVDASPTSAGSDAIDQVNLNLGSGQDYEMTITEIKP
ncbi:hypothetical protein BP6252_12672 [Coleophoma cylindrospora]|uniref:Uncharacterized protein n=1 Tax=Coleophoma cylindrospora TaxID=1849047 RepID=A0A3D8QCK1_9HELO|nr:hypothetical protein BP6252_12672 [Coleophoma cylindrospora]